MSPYARSTQRVVPLLTAITASLTLAACAGSSTAPTPTVTSLTIVSGSEQSATVGTALPGPVVLEVKDQNGNPMSGVTVTVAPGATAGSVAAAQVTSDSAGQVTVQWTLGTVAGSDTAMATATGAPALSVVATATPDVPASIVVMSGDNQNATPGTSLPAPLVIKVVDRYNNAVPNVSVTFSDDANGTFANPTVVTDSTGTAQDTLTLPASAATDDITVTVTTSAGPITAILHEVAA
jgi:hypothetical protein